MIKLQVIGHLGKDCIVNTVSGSSVINFSVAHSEKYKDSGGTEHTKTTWVECNFWPKATGIAAYLKKGTQVYCEGTPEVKQWQAQDGSVRSTLSLRVIKVDLLGAAKAPAANNEQVAQPATRQFPTDANELTEPIDDLPF